MLASGTDNSSPTQVDYLPYLEELCTASAVAENPPNIAVPQLSASSTYPWLVVRFPQAKMQMQGWKLHISSYWFNAIEVLQATVPILVEHQAPFKIAPSQIRLKALNQGEGGQSQVGKFMTVYPLSNEQAVQLAELLDQATRGFQGPQVPTDRQLHASSLVSYRYGAFENTYLQLATGQIVPAIRAADGNLIEDKRLLYYLPPEGISDPFAEAGVAQELPTPRRLIGGRFLRASNIYKTPRTAIDLTIDLDQGQRAILKHTSLQSQVGSQNEKAVNLMRHEAKVLGQIGHHAYFPTLIDLFEEDDKLYLAMEDIESVTLERFILRYRAENRLPSTAEVVRWGRNLVQLLQELHALGWIHRDLKSTNILVSPDGRLRLIDFELAVAIDESQGGRQFGTRGYRSPQHVAGQSASVQDDIYGIGALLYFMATLAEPSQAPNLTDLTERPVLRLNPTLAADLAAVIERSLSQDVSERYHSARELLEAIDSVRVDDGMSPSALIHAVETRAPERTRAQQDFLEYARRLGATLLQSAVPMPSDGAGLVWPSNHGSGSGPRSREINTGSSGALYAICEFADKVGDPGYHDAVRRGAHWLEVAPRVSTPLIPGLYSGEAGIAAVLMRASIILQDDRLMAVALAKANEIATAPLDSPDLFNGAAGRLRMHLWLWRATQESQQLDHARLAGQHLAETARHTGSGDIYWIIPDGFGGLSHQTQLGYSHGIAGTADALIDLYEATRDERYAAYIRDAVSTLKKEAVPVFDGTGVAWPGSIGTDESEQPLRSAFWCHGATGIGLFLLRAHQLFPELETLSTAKLAANAAFLGTRWANPVQCHGLAGNIDFLITLYQATREEGYLNRACELGEIMAAFVREREGAWMAPSELATVFTPDYMVGYAGVAVAFLRLSLPDSFGHPLREGMLGHSLSVAP